MKNQKWLILLVALILIGGTAGALAWLKTHQKLGRPGIKAAPVSGSVRVKMDLPAQVLDYTSTNVPEPAVVLGYLPADTSYVERLYTAPDDFRIQATIVLMGADRTSIHSADYCLTGQGFNGKKKSVVSIPIADLPPRELPVARWDVSGTFPTATGQKVEVQGVYVFWFVADDAQTPDHFDFMKRAALHLLSTGVLQRWAYVSYFAICAPGQEEAAFGRIKNLIANSVGQYEIFPGEKELAGGVVKN
ncbi:MAG TPA: exosortase-associated EpsI family protein [Verrucomicrobiae bacterium]